MTLDDSKTKIIATLGPATSDINILRNMFIEGVDVCRINFSHGNHKDAEQTIKNIRQLNSEMGINIAILGDLQGPKLRVGEMKDGKVMLQKGTTVNFTTHECIGTSEIIYINYEDFAKDVKEGDDILIDDGKIKLEVISTNNNDKVETKVVYGGVLSSRKGVNLPNTDVSLPSLTDKDIEDALFALEQNVDWLALSFVRQASDIIELKQMIKRKKKQTYVVAKIEKPQAIKNFDEIVKEADAIMVARGDLGVEMPFDSVPILQKDMVIKCIDTSTPVIIATQMMESMIENFRPTRAEVNDVANAVIDGADTLMLSGETSVGEFPVETIQNMHKIIQYTEEHGYNYDRGVPPCPESPRFVRDSICYSASIMAKRIGATAIITFTEHGSTASTISGYRPMADIYAFTRHESLLSVLSLLWGVRAYKFDIIDDIDTAITRTIEFLKKEKRISIGDYVIHVGSTPMKLTHKTNMLKVTQVK